MGHTKIEMMWELRKLLREAFALRSEGSTYPRLSRAQGYADGYMRAILESGRATRDEVLKLVAEERELAAGPSTRELTGLESVA